ncbi:hypothetical protein GLX27_001181 [Malassezia furfur]|uniref:RlpA-like protein double-psi beta-barrel domain-containing protein n=1 Tax=Malassezia furfur TaxID=55194 RepID=A0ABY8EM24_MALFU|nr:hypothetical protein GLX27_001181 [Malassezia furfur]
MRIHRRADAGRQLRAREAENNVQLREMYSEFVSKALREKREPVSFEEFLKHPKVAKRGFWDPFGDDDGNSSSSSSSTMSSSASSSASSTASSGGGSDDDSYTGQATYYTPGMGACGKSSSSSDMIVAVSHTLFDKYSKSGNPNDNELCGKKIKATYGGKSTTVTVVDRCTGCKETDLDFSPSAFTKLASKSKGRLHDMKWSFVE